MAQYETPQTGINHFSNSDNQTAEQNQNTIPTVAYLDWQNDTLPACRFEVDTQNANS